MSPAERFRLFGGTVITPDFGFTAGVGLGVVRGFAHQRRGRLVTERHAQGRRRGRRRAEGQERPVPIAAGHRRVRGIQLHVQVANVDAQLVSRRRSRGGDGSRRMDVRHPGGLLDSPLKNVVEVNAPDAARNVTAMTMAAPAPPSQSFTAATAISATTLAAAGRQTLRLEVIEYVGGPTLQDWSPGPGQTVSLASIFSNVNITVVIHRSSLLPNPFTPGKLMTQAELHAMQAGLPPAQPGGWDVTAVMLPVAHETGDLGECSTSPRGAALLSSALRTLDRSRYARSCGTTAHELGHALNLFHNDGDGHDLCCARQGGPLQGLSLHERGSMPPARIHVLSAQWQRTTAPARP